MVGFVLVSLAVVATVLAFSTATRYTPQRPLAYNLQNAYVLRSEATITVREGNTMDCPDPRELDALGLGRLDLFCPRSGDAFDRAFPRKWKTVVRRPGIPLGIALAGTTALGLVGVGLLIFGKKE